MLGVGVARANEVAAMSAAMESFIVVVVVVEMRPRVIFVLANVSKGGNQGMSGFDG